MIFRCTITAEKMLFSFSIHWISPLSVRLNYMLFKNVKEFEKRNSQVVGCSVDSCYSHLAWLNTPKAKVGLKGWIILSSDLNKTIARDYDVLKAHEGIAYRGLFFIDGKGLSGIKLSMISPWVDLWMKRENLDALLYFETNGEVCPAIGSTASRPSPLQTKGWKSISQQFLISKKGWLDCLHRHYKKIIW